MAEKHSKGMKQSKDSVTVVWLSC